MGWLSWIIDHLTVLAPIATFFGALITLRKKVAVFFRGVRGQWNLNVKVMDLELALEGKDQIIARKDQEIASVTDLNTQLQNVLKTTITAQEAIREATEKGFLVTRPPSSNAPTPPPDSSSTSPTKRPAPIEIP